MTEIDLQDTDPDEASAKAATLIELSLIHI